MVLVIFHTLNIVLFIVIVKLILEWDTSLLVVYISKMLIPSFVIGLIIYLWYSRFWAMVN